MNLKKTLGLLVVPVCLGMMITAGCTKQTPKDKAPESAKPADITKTEQAPALPPVIVEVNGEKLTREMANTEIDQRLAGAKGQIPEDRIGEIRSRLTDQIAERFVVRTLLMGEVTKNNVTATKEEIDNRLSKFKSTIPKGMSFEEILKNNGMTEEKVREDIASDIKINKLFTPLTNSLSVTPAEIAEYTEKNKESLAFPESVRARHVLVSVAKTDDEKAKAEKKTKAEGLQKKLAEGADFAAIAKENSDCPSKEMGGDLGNFKRGQMLKPFEDAAFNQATNAIGPVVETEAGFHIIQVTEHQPAGTASKEEVSSSLMSQKCDTEIRKFISSLVQKATIKDFRAPKMDPSMMMQMQGQGPAPAQAAPATR